MTTKVRISHEGGNHPVEVYVEGVLSMRLEKQGDYFEDNVYGGRKIFVRECQHANTHIDPTPMPEDSNPPE